MKYCQKCLFPETKPDLYFDEEGVCDSCRSAEKKHGIIKSIDWGERAEEFDVLVEDAKGRRQGCYDCVVPVSGGKDSTWQVLQAKEKHGMKVLAVTFDQFDQTDTGRHNLDILRDIGVDHVHYTISPKIVRQLVYKGFEIVGDPYWVNHVGMFTVPFHMAVNFSIPLVLYGENPQFEYGGPEHGRTSYIMDKRWRQEFGGMRGLREGDMVDFDISEDDLCILEYPEDEKIRQGRVMGVFYGSFFKWDVGHHLPIVEALGWRRLPDPPAGSWVDYENCDMKYIDIRERIKFLKFGYGRATDQVNIEIRNGRITREEGLEIVKAIDGRVSRKNEDDFCEYLGILRENYLAILDSYTNKNLFKRCSGGDWELINGRY